ncbi:DNA replication initiation control protein YabA [Dolosigranulum pigrum]|jgi:initiation-control protein yabA|uniref:DNA replication initiation control protein YabA n=1 Tax=Dolosigranulum pigrum TaxID=29394 RepID=UPI000DC5CBA6|nr:DNA replication initiation control protein YabA [Dolosigranulum pigrum]QJS97018.1 DNA replication initiation control protein YabA [Dolosigranulum pigrum]QTJ35760.1 DNA replication initiation control protein YabA [Dolosigranulum pigrum]
MDKKDLYDTLMLLEEQSKGNVETLRVVRQQLSELAEENQALKVENQHLRDRLNGNLIEEEGVIETDNPSGLTKSRLNLESIYDDGFHVCNHLYGQRRIDDESCAFCLDVIYGDRK